MRVCIFVRDMADYAAINAAYISVLSHVNPPVRVCVEVPLSAANPVVLEAIAYRPFHESDSRKHTMHVQTISHWAPANIGPYSQGIRVSTVCILC